MKDVFGITRVKTEEEVKEYRQKIGVAYDNEDGSIFVKLNAFPVSGRLLIKERQNGGLRATIQERQKSSEG